MKAINLIRRFIKRKAEWRKAHPLELLESQMSQMAQEEEEEIPPMEDEKRKKKKGCIGKVCSKLGHLILGTKEEEEDDESDSDDDELIEEKDMEGLTPDERTKLTIDTINKCREDKDWDEVVNTILSQMKNEVERDKLRTGTSSTEVLVNWKHTANVMAFHVGLPKMLYQ